MAGAKIVVAFDLYGTLLSTESIGKELAKHCEQEKASQVAALWRRYQLEYTWRLNAMGAFHTLPCSGNFTENLHQGNINPFQPSR